MSAADHARLAVMAMPDAHRNALSAAMHHQSKNAEDVHMRAFYAALVVIVDEAGAWLKVRENSTSIAMIIDPFET